MTRTLVLGLLVAAWPLLSAAACPSGMLPPAPAPATLHCLELRAPEAAAPWFETRLGFREIARAADGATITLERGLDRLTLLRAPADAAAPRDVLRLTLEPAAFDTVLAAARAAGERLVWSARDLRREGATIVHLVGPEGHRIALVRASTPPPQNAPAQNLAARRAG
jgi:hypothetical protein